MPFYHSLAFFAATTVFDVLAIAFLFLSLGPDDVLSRGQTSAPGDAAAIALASLVFYRMFVVAVSYASEGSERAHRASLMAV